MTMTPHLLMGLPATREAHLDVAMIPLLCEYVVTGIPCSTNIGTKE